MATKPPSVEDHAPWKPPPWEPADASALQALNAGTADKNQQKRALDWIIDHGAATYDLSYRPGVAGERDTSFAEGRRFVGLQIVKLLKINVGLLVEKKNAGRN